MKVCKSFVLFLLIVVTGCNSNLSDTNSVRFNLVKEYLNEHLDKTIEVVKKLQQEIEKSESIALFEEARREFKKIEAFLTSFAPIKIKGVNGPPLPNYKEDSGKILPAIGFQAIEEQLYSDEPLDSGLYYYRVRILAGYLEAIKDQIKPNRINATNFFISIHKQFLSVFSLGIISFDTPTSLRGIDESIISLNSIKELYNMALSDTLKTIDLNLHSDFITNIRASVDYLKNNNDFETFNRYHFTKNYINKLTTSWRDIRRATQLLDAPKDLAINIDAPTFFESNYFNLEFFDGFKRVSSESQVLLGEKLFFDPKLSASGNLSCATCHQPKNAYQDGLKLGRDKNGDPLKRNTPTIINSVFQRKFFWDGRSDNLVQQINLVFDNEMEFGRSSAHDLSILNLSNDQYDSLFTQAFPDSKVIRKKSVVRALSAYVSTLNAFNSRFDRNMRGELDDFTDQEILGMNLYMGKALCATCHFLPLTNGTVPPNFRETEKEVIGTPETAENKEVDDDEGFYWVYKEGIHKYMFKTPTVRNIQFTAPYMHNGVYETLEQVMDFYNKGGGGGMGFDLPHQTLPFDSLSLSNAEQQAIIAFMKTLSDTTISKDPPKLLAHSE